MTNSDMAAYMQNRRRLRKEDAIKSLGSVCSICSASELLEFDHIDPSTKSMNISSPKLLDGCIENFWREVEKCQLLCRKCHLDKTRENSEHGGGHNKHSDQGCGTGMRYADKCRCGLCKNWKKMYRDKQVDYSGKVFYC